jgi:hypothetical protein
MIDVLACDAVFLGFVLLEPHNFVSVIFKDRSLSQWGPATDINGMPLYSQPDTLTLARVDA